MGELALVHLALAVAVRRSSRDSGKTVDQPVPLANARTSRFASDLGVATSCIQQRPRIIPAGGHHILTATSVAHGAFRILRRPLELLARPQLHSGSGNWRRRRLRLHCLHLSLAGAAGTVW